MQMDMMYMLVKETGNTLYMVAASFFFSSIFGGLLGLGLFITAPYGLKPMKGFHSVVSLVLSFLTAIPFAILIVILFPITRWIVGTSLGATASIVPLTFGALPLVASFVSEALRTGALTCVEPAIALGIPKIKILKDILFPEILPQLIFSLKNLVVHLIACSTFAGFVGGGGLGQILLQYGYYRFDLSVTLSVLMITLFFIEGIRILGDTLGRRILQHRGIL
ncbi:ABC transporter permease subunit [Chlamydia abortus]|uniref:ABC transport integral membrane subunit n=1 Tax=Chlamydia abortus (strain DSM 27085 / S26/3) TaxID=218497 RepID=Q5L5Z0_CHLAB|nr:ABC transporter permease subunit [Chlamydia abortus]ASD30650.1 amino acid ABC transporter permease [Chlamydia abortus]EGK69253.1 putative ABC transport integral membrane subunit [Chlamydia abortus LLG]QEM73852.1 ABC transporter permease subunit [Chlamydia abortus]QRR32176.1 ABC transporter permease subunit [Chlamydia abortus]CAH63941.1 putative ABC transport integral membrane subunit [Chlamydia abortus S26/3]